MRNPWLSYDKILDLFKNNSFFKNVFMLASGTAAGQAVSVLSMPLVSRLYTPEDLGKYGLFLSFVYAASVGSCLLYDPAIVEAKSEEDAATLVSISFFLLLITTPLAGLTLFIFIQNHLFSFDKLPLWSVVLASITFWLMGIFSILKYWLIRCENFSSISKVAVSQNIVRSFGQIILALSPVAPMGLMGGEMFGRANGIWKMFEQSRELLMRLIPSVNYSRFRQVFIQYGNYPKYVLPSSMLNVIGVSLPLPIIVYLHGSIAGGYFLLAQRILYLPLALVGGSVADVFHGQASIYLTKDPQRIYPLFKIVAKNLVKVGFTIIIPMAILSPWMIKVLFGEQWTEVGYLIGIMSPWAISSLIVSSLSRILLVLGAQKQKLIYDFFTLFSQGAVLFGSNYLTSNLRGTVLMMAVLSSISYCIYFLIILRCVYKTSKN